MDAWMAIFGNGMFYLSYLTEMYLANIDIYNWVEPEKASLKPAAFGAFKNIT